LSKSKQRAAGAKHWVMLEHYLLTTPAWGALSANARSLYIEVKRRYNGRNNGMIAFSARDAGDTLNASHHTGARVLQELQDHGFLAVTEQSDFKRKVKVAREYRLTEVRDDRPGLEAPPTKEFARWRPPENLKVSRTGEIHSRIRETDAPEKVRNHA
jgi:hypothetical protein